MYARTDQRNGRRDTPDFENARTNLEIRRLGNRIFSIVNLSFISVPLDSSLLSILTLRSIFFASVSLSDALSFDFHFSHFLSPEKIALNFKKIKGFIFIRLQNAADGGPSF